MRKGIFTFFCFIAIAVLAGSVSSAYAFDSYGGGCNGCHGSFLDPSSPKSAPWPVNKHDTHRNQMLDSTNADRCGACHQVNGDGTRTNSSRGYSGLPGLGCVGCHGNDYNGVKLGAGLRQHHRATGASSCGATSCHAGDPTPLPESNNPPYYGLAGVNITSALKIGNVVPEDFSGDGKGLDNDGDLLYDQLAGGPPPPTVDFTVTQPAAGESVPAGAPYAVTWTAQNGAASYKVKLSIDGGVTWSILAKGVTDTTTNWPVPAPKKNISKAIIKVFAFDSSNVKLGAVKSGTFSIDVLTIATPAAAEIVPQNSTYNITWAANGTAALPDQVIVKYTLNNGTTWKTAQGTPGVSSFNWTVPAVSKPKTKAKVKVILKVAGVTVAKAVSAKFTVN